MPESIITVSKDENAEKLQQLKDGKIVAAFKNLIVIWNEDSSFFGILKGHRKDIRSIIQREDGKR